MRQLTVCAFLLLAYCVGRSQDTVQHVQEGRRNSPAHLNSPYVILISIDGFRYDYADRYNATNIIRLRNSGVQATSMIPSFPSVTFPNHYTIATGLYPSHHGLVYNQFYDRERKATYNMSDRKAVEDGTWYGGTPLWVLAEKNGMLSASYHFVGSEAAIQQTYPTYWYKYSEGKNIDFRIQKLVDWLKLPEDRRPHLITFYMSEVDDAGHNFGPDTKQTGQAVLYIDDVMRKLTARIDSLGLPVNYIFLADHGMAQVDTVTRINIRAMIDTAQFIIRGGGTSLQLYAKNAQSIQSTYDQLKAKEKDFIVYKREDIPRAWHFNKSDDSLNRIGDLFIVPVYPKVLSSWSGKISPGAHGYDPVMKEMHATFYAWGPQIKKGRRINSFENIHVYPAVCRLLGLPVPTNIDGKKKVLRKIFK
ncbi:MAG: alkaline phosphatase family protein [Chitinophagaceae bacterium]|nr:alkaline phosphatase family protein [Chitinophagaceae bacterium]